MDKAPSLTELCDLIEAYCDMRPPPDPQSDFLAQLGLWGDDVVELLSAFASRYGVDMRGYLWYFHTGEEGANPGALFFKPPNARVPYIPLTLAVLQQAARLRYWPIVYPPHSLPQHRWDITISKAIFGVPLLLLVALMILDLLARMQARPKASQQIAILSV